MSMNETEIRKLFGIPETADFMEAVKGIKAKAEANPYDLNAIGGLVEQAVAKQVAALAKVTDRRIEFPAQADPRTVGQSKEFQSFSDDVYITATIMGVNPRSLKMYQRGAEIPEIRKALDTATAGSGLEWVPTGLSQEIIARVMLQLKVAALHQRITMPTDPFKIPAVTGAPTARLGAENTAPTVSQPTTASTTLDAKKIITYVAASYEVEEDAIQATMPLIKNDIVNSLAEGLENAILNGDTAVTHMDSDTTSSEDVRKAFDGYRKSAVTAAKVDLATFNITGMRAIRAGMGKYGVNPDNLAWVVGVKSLNKVLNLAEIQTLDKLGPNAVILTGEVVTLDGIPVIVSEFIREDLNATGIYDGVTTTQTVLHLVYRPGFILGDKRTPMLEVDRDIKAQTNWLVASQRTAFAKRIVTAGAPIVGTGYNIA